jgi:pSer/pThr/pTyr-binding forkhead associated (FHA) protein
MNFPAFNTLLFASKWVFIGLIYVALSILILTVRREMAQRMKEKRPQVPAAPGRLRVLGAGKDKLLRPGQVLQLQPETALGAESENDIILSDPFVSSSHARIRWDGVRWWIEDLDSRNGTYLEGRRCPPHVPQPIPPGANIQLGDTSFELLD